MANQWVRARIVEWSEAAYRDSFLLKKISSSRKIAWELDCTDVPPAPGLKNFTDKFSIQGALEGCSVGPYGNLLYISLPSPPGSLLWEGGRLPGAN